MPGGVTYQFLKANEFIGKQRTYFVEKRLHVNNNIHTVGKIVYTAEKILLKPISGDKQMVVKNLCDLIPGNGTYVQIYGSLSFFKDQNDVCWFDFDKENDTTEDLFVVANIICWTDLENEDQAKRLEKMLYEINS